MLTAILLLTALGADTTEAKVDTNELRVTDVAGKVVFSSKTGIDPAPADSLCARCGKVCVMTEVYRHVTYGDIHYYPELKLRCPDHGRHVEWLGSPVYTTHIVRNAFVRYWTKGHYAATSNTVYNDIVIADSVEIGLREDGTVVWRKAKP